MKEARYFCRQSRRKYKTNYIVTHGIKRIAWLANMCEFEILDTVKHLTYCYSWEKQAVHICLWQSSPKYWPVQMHSKIVPWSRGVRPFNTTLARQVIQGFIIGFSFLYSIITCLISLSFTLRCREMKEDGKKGILLFNKKLFIKAQQLICASVVYIQIPANVSFNLWSSHRNCVRSFGIKGMSLDM